MDTKLCRLTWRPHATQNECSFAQQLNESWHISQKLMVGDLQQQKQATLLVKATSLKSGMSTFLLLQFQRYL